MSELPNPYESPRQRTKDELDDKSDLYASEPPLIGYKVQVAFFAIACLCSIIAAGVFFGRNGATIVLIVVCMLIAAARRN